MTRGAARTTADVVLAAAGLLAVYVVVTTPPLRRLAWTAVRIWLGATVPAYLIKETRQAWMESGRMA